MTFSRMIDARLHGERDRVLPRVFARPLEIRRGETLSQKELLDRLNDLGYAQRTQVQNPGEFAVDGARSASCRAPARTPAKLLVDQFSAAAPAPRRRGRAPRPCRRSATSHRVADGRQAGGLARHHGCADADGADAARVKRRQVPLSVLPSRMVQAVLAIEDRRYYSHPGIDPIRMVGALFTNMFGNRPYLEGASTITQQLAQKFLPDRRDGGRAADAPALASAASCSSSSWRSSSISERPRTKCSSCI